MEQLKKISLSLTCAMLLCINAAEAHQSKSIAEPRLVVDVIDSAAARDAVKLAQQSHRVWQPKIANHAIWRQLSKPLRNTEYSKFVIDLKTNNIYFIDANVFTLHIDFVLGYLTHSPRQDAWTFGGMLTKKMIVRTAKKLEETFSIAPLMFRPDFSYQERVAKQFNSTKVSIIYNAEIYQDIDK